jgi:hypothetical protein
MSVTSSMPQGDEAESPKPHRDWRGMSAHTVRRVVTGVTPEGKSVVVEDGTPPRTVELDYFELDDGFEVRLGTGDVVIQNGTRHAWRNRGSEPCVMAFVSVGAVR